MSAIGGQYNFDGCPVEESILSTIETGLATRAPDGGGRFLAGSIGMVYKAFHTNNESRLESQPFISMNNCVLCWDGRLDNRDELVSILRHHLHGNFTDVSVVMGAYLRWGIDFLTRLIGDFALSVWDPMSRSLILARDIIGPRTLYFHKNSQQIVWSTELSSLLKLAGTPLKLNDDYVAGFLAGLPETDQTPYSQIKAVPPAHAVVITGNRFQLHRFWTIDPTFSVRYKKDQDYEAEFRRLFCEAVKCRLRSNGAAWAELSGGLDSSAIVCMANDIIKSGAGTTKRLETVSRIFDEAAKSDERKYIIPVEKKIGRSGLHLREDDFRLLSPWPKEYSPTLPTYVANLASYYEALYKAMNKAGARLLLSGLGGGEVLLGDGNPFCELADLLQGGRLLRFHCRLQEWRKISGKDYFRFLWRHVITPLLPRRFQGASKRKMDSILRFYNPEFCKRLDLRDRMFGSGDLFGFQRAGARYQSVSFHYAMKQISAGFWQELCPVEFSYPFTHRPLVEFLLAIPVEQKVRPGETKSILRRALHDLLPPELINRRERRITIWPAAAKAAVRERANMRRMFKNSRAAELGYLNSEAILAAVDSGKPDAYVISLVPFEHWLRSLEKRCGTLASGG